MRNTCTKTDCDREVFGRGLCARHYQLARYHGELPTSPPPRPCEQCGEVFSARKWNARYCSRRCNDAARYARTRRPEMRTEACDQCGVALPEDRRTDTRFCSEKCGNDYRNAQRSAALKATRRAAPRPCRGCEGSIPPERRGNALYCSEQCKISSRRHEAYGLTRDELQALLDQHEQCAICRTDDWGGKGPQVDHCHSSGAVRGILCNNCNQGLGRFKDDPERLRAAARYLEEHAAD